MRMKFARLFFRVGYALIKGRFSAGFVVRQNGKWQAIKL